MKATLERILFNFSEGFSSIAGLTPLLSWLQYTNFPVFLLMEVEIVGPARVSRVGPLVVSTEQGKVVEPLGQVPRHQDNRGGGVGQGPFLGQEYFLSAMGPGPPLSA